MIFCFKLFFHQYFTRKDEKEKAKATKVGKRKGDGGSSSEDDDDEEAEKASSDEVADVDDEDGSDADEAEIWKVPCSLFFFWSCFNFPTHR